jgi:hypothetical protein
MAYANTKIEKQLLDDHIDRRVEKLFDFRKKLPPFKKEFYIIESSKIIKATIEDEWIIFQLKRKLRLYK